MKKYNNKIVWCEYRSQPERRQRVLDGWKQLAEDLKTHVVVFKDVVQKPEPIMALPALSISVTGQVLTSNLDVYQNRALAYIDGINEKLETDEDFEQSKLDIKFCHDAEKQLEYAKKSALAQTHDIDTLFKVIDYISEALRTKRLSLTNLDKKRKEQIKCEIISQGQTELNKHIAFLTENMMGTALPPFKPDFAGAVKGRSSVVAMRDAVSVVVANAKIDANRIARQIIANQDTMKLPPYSEYYFMFSDIGVLVQKQTDDFIATLDARIARFEKEKQAKELEEIGKQREAQQAQQAQQDQAQQDQEKPIQEAPIDNISLSGGQAIAFVNALIACGAKKTKSWHDAVDHLNAQSPDKLEGYRIDAALCSTIGELTSLLNSMGKEHKVALKPYLTKVQSQLKKAV